MSWRRWSVWISKYHMWTFSPLEHGGCPIGKLDSRSECSTCVSPMPPITAVSMAATPAPRRSTFTLCMEEDVPVTPVVLPWFGRVLYSTAVRRVVSCVEEVAILAIWRLFVPSKVQIGGQWMAET